jgi:hypothetical protein
MRVVAPSHLLVLWSRLGQYNPADLDTLLWKERSLFQDWAQATSIVLTEDYPIFSALKRSFAKGDKPWAKRIRTWVDRNKDAHSQILTQLRLKGPLPTEAFDVKFVESWRSSGWSEGRNISTMLMILWAQGKVMIAGRKGNRKMWELTERFLPKWAPRERLSDSEVFRHAAQKSLRALGVARSRHIEHHYIRHCYGDIKHVLSELEAAGRIVHLNIQEGKRAWPGPWYIHVDDLPLLNRLEAGEWESRTTLLSPFDNLICDRSRTEQVFDFRFRFEVYVPKSERKYGCYVMPILHGDRLIGRIDPVMNRKHSRLTVNAVYAEPDALKTKETGRAVAAAIDE